ncbi:maleylpyruvate isomerase N-terminal domain-containing protein [Micromonospora harpali]|uniref:Maleylpyruvate isomerase N-terminal domain-containing protein n=1 Tax=Micromonospora harpali TaxID=1490225 RepID=A0ABW1HR30_9ACTN
MIENGVHKIPTFSDHLRLISERSTAFRAAVAAAPSLDMQVPTHPERTLFDLVQHVGMGRRKSAAIVAAGPADTPPEKSAWDDGTGAPREREGPAGLVDRVGRAADERAARGRPGPRLLDMVG